LRFIFKLVLLFFSIIPCFADQLIIEPDNGREPILAAISNAESSVNLVIYGLTDLSFAQALAISKNNGKTIHVLLEPHPYKIPEENTESIRFLQHAHIPLHWPSTQFRFLHQKTFVFDNRIALVMTFNLTNSSFKNERNFALLITNPSMVQEIQRVFDADWQHQSITVSHPNLVWSPDNSRKKILALLQQAQSEIKIYTENITDYQIIGALAKAARSHINVQILLSSKPNKKSLNYLTHAGVVIYQSHHYLIHAKAIMIDRKRALIGSINLTQPSLDSNRELSVITENNSIIQTLITTFNHDTEESR